MFPNAPGRNKPQVVILVLNASGCLLLSILTVTLGLSKRLNRRDPVVNNFLYIWILESGLSTFDELVLFSGNTLDSASVTREAILTMIALVATLNLSIHLLFVMRAAFYEPSPKKKKIRSLLLVVSPYIVGLIPVSELFFPQVGQIIFGGVAFAIAIFTPFVDLAVIIYFIRWYDKARKAKFKNLISLAFCVRLLIFSLHRLLYIILLFLGSILGTQKFFYVEAFAIVQNLFPLLAFFVLGLHFDVLVLWFPWLSRFNPKTSHKIERESTFPLSNDTPPSQGRGNFVYQHIDLDPMDIDMDMEL